MGKQQRETILLVDDEPPVVALVKTMLVREGYTVLASTDPEDAIQMAEDEADIGLLLTDIAMPQLNGRELADRVRALRRGLRVLYMSGYMPETLLKYYDVSTAGIPFLQKPFTPEVLARKVREVLDAPSAEAAGQGSEMR